MARAAAASDGSLRRACGVVPWGAVGVAGVVVAGVWTRGVALGAVD